MNLISVLAEGKDSIDCIIETDNEFKVLHVLADDSIDESSAFKKSDYKGYEHFALVFGKFEPYAFFLR